MITIPTTLILGAGASQPFGYPIGRVLKGNVIHLNDEYLHEHGFTREQYREFTQHLKRSTINSVDAFIERFPQYRDIGTACIALALAMQEFENNLFSHHSEAGPSWYEILANALDDGISPVRENKLSIVTFNYDRSLEYYLVEVLRHNRDIAVDAAIEQLSTIPMLHVYGSIGECPPQRAGSRPYATTNESIHRAIVERHFIRLMPDVRKEHQIFQQACDLILQAKRVVFLGFGFDATNVQRLRAFEEKWPDSSRRETWATTTGMGQRQIDVVMQSILHGNLKRENLAGSLTGMFQEAFQLSEQSHASTDSAECDR